MSQLRAMTPAEMETYCRRYGLTGSPPEHLARFAELADRAAEVGRRLPRMPSKSDEPAHIFGVPQK